MDDYEDDAAREWQVVGQQKDKRKSRPFIARAEFEPDTQARTQWRERAPPTRHKQLPKDFVPSAFGPQRGRARGGRNDSPYTSIPELAKIARDTGTEITQHVGFGVGRFRGQQQLHVYIYGSEEAAESAENQINEWLKAYVPEPSTRSHSWAKVNSVGTPEQRDKYLAKVREAEEREQYRREPPEDRLFPAVGKFEWDTSYSSPGDVLGTRLEACDSLRTDLMCFVISDKKHSATIRVLGHDDKMVKTAVNRLRGAFFQAISRDNAGHTAAVYLFNPLSRSSCKSRVEYQSVFPPDMSATADESNALGKIAKLGANEDIDGDTLSGRVKRADEIPAENAKRLKKAMAKALSTAKYFRGNLQMRATLGVFLLKRFRKNVNDFESFEDMMKEGEQVDGDVDPNSVHLSGSIVDELIKNHSVWDPNNLENPTSIPTPTYSVKFLLKHRHDIPDLKFEAEFEYDNQNDYIGNAARRWSRNIHAPGHTVKLLDVCLVDLESESEAWSIDINAMEFIPSDRAPELSEFADEVSLIPSIATQVAANDEKSRGRFISFKEVPGVVVHWLVQKKHWTFEYGRSGYLIDVARAEEFHLKNPSSAHPIQTDLNHESPKWRVTVFRKAWDVDLAENAHLQLGEGMRGNKTVADFFPANEGARKTRSDVAQFLHILNDVRAMIRGGVLD